MSRKKKKQDKDASTPAENLQPQFGYVPFFSPDFKADLRWWYRQDPKKADKL